MTAEQILFQIFCSLAVTIETNCASTFIEAVRPQTCDTPLCANPPPGCVTHTVRDEFNCPVTCVYSCGAPWCPPLTCIAHCPGDYVRDKMGCNTCDCKPPCEQRRCWLECPFGHLRDKNGCRTCACAFINTLPPYIVLPTSKSPLEQKPTTEQGNVAPRDATTASDTGSSTITTTSKSLYCILSSGPSTDINSM